MRFGVVWGGLTLALLACGGEEPAASPNFASDDGVALDVGQGVDGAGDLGNVGDGAQATPDVAAPTPPEQPAWFPDRGTAPTEWVSLPQLEGPVRVIYDDLGIPHIYASNRKDLAFAQGYVTARHRLFQFHTLRMAASGRLAELLGADSLQGDVYLRILKLRHVAEEMAARTETKHPKEFGLMQAYADGVNQWIGEVNADKTKAGMEVAVFGEMPVWTVADTMTVVRLQTWDLSFGGVVEADELFFDLQDLKEKLGDEAAAPIAADLLDFTAPNLVSTLDTAAGKP